MGKRSPHCSTLSKAPKTTTSLCMRQSAARRCIAPSQIWTWFVECLMSALGQKQTFAVQNVMSALPPKATSNGTYGMSAMGQKRTSGDAIMQLVANEKAGQKIFPQRYIG